jgi:hypothetical protein
VPSVKAARPAARAAAVNERFIMVITPAIRAFEVPL